MASHGGLPRVELLLAYEDEVLGGRISSMPTPYAIE
jgi:hypothetical protein